MDTPSTSKDKCMTLASSPELQIQSSTGASHMALQCVGSLQVQCRLQLGFICGSLPVPTDNEAMMCPRSVVEAAIVPAISLQNERVVAPQYRMLPNQTDLNTLFLSDVEHEQILPITSGRPPEGVNDLCKAWGQSYHNQPLARKCEALAVSALAGYEDQIDVIAPVEILKKIFKIPYSKARLSIAVHRVGQTLILNTGPDVEEGENLVRTKKNQAKAMEKALFLKFAMQSVRAEACDCPLQQNSEEKSTTSFTSKSTTSMRSNDLDDDILDPDAHANGWQYGMNNDATNKQKMNKKSTKSLNASKHGAQNEHKQRVSWSQSDQNSVSGIDPHKKSSIVGERQKNPDCIQNEPGNHKRSNSDGFLRVLFWQLEEMKMLLGSDLLLFSNEKHVAVSLHLWEMERQVTPLMWLDAWLDNVMASVPELAICYHHNGIVQGYELLKTDDIFLLKGLSEDGTSFFHPHIIQQNALSVLRFLQENCKEDLGTYWLFKNAGEDLVQLFNLSVITNKRTTTTKKDEKKQPLPSSCGSGNRSCSLPLGVLLYRLAHRLSLSKDPSDRCKCANFFKKCLELLGEQEHLFVRASAHEHVARLILKCHEELGSILMPFMLEANEHYDGAPKRFIEQAMDSSLSLCSETKQRKSSKSVSGTNHLNSDKDSLVPVTGDTDQSLDRDNNCLRNEKLESDRPVEKVTEMNVLGALNDAAPMLQNSHDEDVTTESNSSLNSGISHTLVMPVSARLTAVHHVSQAIKALRWQRQLQDVEGKVFASERKAMEAKRYIHLVPVCAYGEIDCIEYYDIRECEFGPFMDRKLVQLVLLLGESYLALGQAYKDDGQLKWALKSVELSCSVYESMPLHWNDNTYVSDEQIAHWLPVPTSYTSNLDMSMQLDNDTQAFCQPILQDSSTRIGADKDLFWGQAWILVGDIYVEYQRLKSRGFTEEKEPKYNGLTMAQEVVKEVKRLRKKLSQNKKNCTVCSLVRCSCESDRASSGRDASSSSPVTTTRKTRKHGKKEIFDSLDSLEKNKVTSECIDQSLKHEVSLLPAQDNVDVKTGRDTNLSTEKAEVKEIEPEKKNKSDIFSFLDGPNDVNEENLENAAECYDAAVLLFSKTLQGSEEMKTALKKKGWTYNEIGRMKLACGNIKDSKVMFDKAIGAFKDAKDQINVVLIYCNIGHGQRAAAEALVAQLDSWKGGELYEQIFKKVFDDAVSQYTEALRSYNTAKTELKLLTEVSDSESIGLRNEVLTQCAHTYLRLGMLLAREDKCGHSFSRFPTVNKHNEFSDVDSMDNQMPQYKKIHITTNGAIREAIALYEMLGNLRAQELAFAHFQLACYHRDCCFAIMKSEMRILTESASHQQLKRYLSLAERHWLKALKYYRASIHPDMFLEILMQKSALNVAVFSSSGSVSMLDVALSDLLEGRHVNFSEDTSSTLNENFDGKEFPKPSERVLEMYSEQLRSFLKTMLATSQKMHKKNSLEQTTRNPVCIENSDVQKSGQGGDIEKLKSMYRLALKSGEVPDVKGLYELWKT